MKVTISKNKIKYGSAFVLLAVIIAGLFISLNYFYGMWPFQIKDWTFGGVVFKFRADLKSAVNVPTSAADCKGIYDEFNNFYLKNVTVYINQNTNVADIANVEATEFAYKLTTYYSIEPIQGSIVPGINGDLLNSTTDTNSTLSNAKIFIVTPPSADKYGVYYTNYSAFVYGNTLSQLDLATEKAMMCMFGMNLTYGFYTASPVFQ